MLPREMVEFGSLNEPTLRAECSGTVTGLQGFPAGWLPAEARYSSAQAVCLGGGARREPR